MGKRYLRLDIEYEFDETFSLHMLSDNIRRILREDIPYAKVMFSRDTSVKDDLDNPRFKGRD